MKTTKPRNEEFLALKLKERAEAGSLRTLSLYNQSADFCSNDYLGFARMSFQSELEQLRASYPVELFASTGSRLISGNSVLAEEFERYVAGYFGAESALLFNSGYDANVGLLSSVAGRNDTIIYDEYVHASIRDGIRLGLARSYSFRHNDLDDLRKKIQHATGNVFIVSETVFSMDGDEAPVEDLVQLAKEERAELILDEAHATGYIGPAGKGIVAERKLEDHIFARIVTFGKALGGHGAVVLGSDLLRQFLINFARSFIYSTAPSPDVILRNWASLMHLPHCRDPKEQLYLHILRMRELVNGRSWKFIISRSAIHCLLVPGNEQAAALAEHLQSAGFAVKAILSPTVPEGQERIRVCLHAFNTDEQIQQLVNHIDTWFSNPA